MPVQQPKALAFLVQSVRGSRLLARFYDQGLYTDERSKKAFEERLHQMWRTAGSTDMASESAWTAGLDAGAFSAAGTALALLGDNDVLVSGNQVVLYRPGVDLCFLLVTLATENEVIFSQVLSCLTNALGALVGELSEFNILRNYEALLLVVDEVFDDSGAILELDPVEVRERIMPVLPRTFSVGDQSFSEALHQAKATLTRTLLK
ncbi:coatomer protein complex, subunit zeta 2 [Cyanidiococcus yangmingshanensis]|uniref:Coatomer subunit zeta n=1 Tax=Cyanidiococcus yangmingshanensis TaxID=2690220 RepID=A0A7J7IHU5_9RHOD|nr:coatomer protein complex, subunit zeta 2 [Cyanidiococcus yangmingshanensis]